MTTFTSYDEERLMNKLRWRIVPFIFLLYIISMVDRVNISFAALEMNKDLGITATAFGAVAGIFFIPYFLFEIPSNILMHRIGARIWISRIMISWGIVVVLTAFIKNVTHLAVLRCLLGIAEAGFYPSMILYLTFWFPQKHQARTVSVFMTGLAAANIITGPVTSWILDNVNWLGLPGWRWVFILEGLPAIILGILTLFVLVDRPQQARFLTKEEKEWLVTELRKEHEAKVAKVNISKWEVLKNGVVWQLTISYLGYVMALYGLGLWLPQIIKALSGYLSNTQIGLISTLPYICGVIGMVLVANHSDKTMERRFHVGLPIIMAAVGLVALTKTKNLVLSMALISISTVGIYSYVGSFWTLPNTFLSEETAAVGIALINAFGNLGGFVGPYIVGFLKDATNSINAGMYVLASCALIACILAVALPKKHIMREGMKTTSKAM
ncbi:permeases of the major facilitator superfamily [Moorella thermoacetica Y72]|uniref:Permeases of the major facilitator superfamily n=2 Tax=Neomoorella thermoacetica TaxID=1525 RepID=A0A0S6U8T9_NEOTH|nr:MFS transporter [Moorella thermoacetica]OIQ07634.1 putative tartrate transporter [Moorella thermoacetica]GAF25125.1 permeases of the major facilitator superfamily [Moorella thermoacetica Y72]